MLRLIYTLVFVCAGAFALPATAQTFPDKSVRIIVATPAGGGSDLLSRILAKKLQEIWGQPVIVENHSGAQGSVGTAMAMKAKPDGYTLSTIFFGSIAINPYVYDNVGYDVLKDVVPVVRATQQPMVLVANPNLPVKSLKDVESLARSKPGSLSFATTGSLPQILGELLKRTTNTDLLHVKYNGAGQGIGAILGGVTDLMISSPASVVAHIKAGKLRGIAVMGKERLDSMPDVPTALESGYPQLSDLVEWYGFAVPAGTPAPIVAKLNADFVKALNDPEVQKSIRGLGMGPAPTTTEEFARQVKYDYERLGKIVKDSGIKAE